MTVAATVARHRAARTARTAHTASVTERGQLDRWMTAAADGDRGAIDPLFHALWPIVVGYAGKLLGDPALAEDAAQDALVKLFAQVDRWDRERSALTWALAIATWECRTIRRRIQRRAESADLPTVAVDGVALAEERELVRAALATLATLAQRDVDAIVAACTEDAELRAQLAPATFRKRLERALVRFRTSWRSRHGTL
jgi:RNA polymerase sigma-70 factor, ECF subfamily